MDRVDRCHRLDPHHIFGVLVAQLTLDPQAQRRTMLDRERAVVHRPGEDRLRVERVDQVDRFIIGPAIERVGAMEDQEARAVLHARHIEDRGQLRSVPFPDRAPPLDAIVAGDLHPLRQRPDIGEREVERSRHQPVHSFISVNALEPKVVTDNILSPTINKNTTARTL